MDCFFITAGGKTMRANAMQGFLRSVKCLKLPKGKETLDETASR
jgi:hypothetical protein